MTATIEAPASQPIADMEADSLIGNFPEGQRLVGSQCNACGCTMIGSRVVCSSCISRDVSRVALPSTGVLYSFTRIHVGAEGIRPLGYVDLDNGVRTLADIHEGDIPLRPDMRVELDVEDDWFFAPAADDKREV